MVTKEQIVRWLELTAKVLHENKDYLTQLDSAIGDADHGTNMDRGFTKVAEKLPTVADKDIGNILKTVGMTLISSVGGASGPLYGTFFQRGGMAADAKEELTDEDLLTTLQAAVDGVLARGRAQPGDKTMIDALLPAMAALRAAGRSIRVSGVSKGRLVSIEQVAGRGCRGPDLGVADRETRQRR